MQFFFHFFKFRKALDFGANLKWDQDRREVKTCVHFVEKFCFNIKQKRTPSFFKANTTRTGWLNFAKQIMELLKVIHFFFLFYLFLSFILLDF
jgi:hypothetical protein